MSVLMALIGAAILIVAGDLLVRGAVALSLRAGLSLALISLTVVAFGTSAPELVICIQAALDDAPDIAVGNVVGSNVANIMLVIGAAAIIMPIRDDTQATFRNYLLMIGASVLLIAIGWLGEIGFALGVLMLALLAGILWQAYSSGKNPEIDADVADGTGEIPVSRMLLLLIVGIVGLPVGAHLLIEGARDIALQMGISEAAIGLTLVALGTSLPELAATGMAAFRGRGEMALGNAIGSNLFNILGILGTTAIVTPVPISSSFQTFGIPVMALSSLVLMPFLWNGLAIGRISGIALSVGYCLFTAYLIST